MAVCTLCGHDTEIHDTDGCGIRDCECKRNYQAS